MALGEHGQKRAGAAAGKRDKTHVRSKAKKGGPAKEAAAATGSPNDEFASGNRAPARVTRAGAGAGFADLMKKSGSKTKPEEEEDEDEEEALHKLVTGHQDFEFFKEGAKVRCLPTKHEMPASLKQIREYIAGSKYMKQKEWYNLDFSKYEPHIVPHKKQKKFLWCILTKTVIPMDPKKVAAHVGGNRYKAALKEIQDVEDRKVKKKADKLERIRVYREANPLPPGKGRGKKSKDDKKDGAALDGKAKKMMKKKLKRKVDRKEGKGEGSAKQPPSDKAKTSPKLATKASPRLSPKQSPKKSPATTPAADGAKVKKLKTKKKAAN